MDNKADKASPVNPVTLSPQCCRNAPEFELWLSLLNLHVLEHTPLQLLLNYFSVQMLVRAKFRPISVCAASGAKQTCRAAC